MQTGGRLVAGKGEVMFPYKKVFVYLHMYIFCCTFAEQIRMR